MQLPSVRRFCGGAAGPELLWERRGRGPSEGCRKPRGLSHLHPPMASRALLDRRGAGDVVELPALASVPGQGRSQDIPADPAEDPALPGLGLRRGSRTPNEETEHDRPEQRDPPKEDDPPEVRV